MSTQIDQVISKAAQVLVGKEKVIRLSLACLLARGHLLIEDLPGVGKTTLAHVWARLLGLDYQRIQFTSDLLPADIVGVSIFDRDNQTFQFHPGPVFSQLVLADEINRATPKAQSALLEAMEEGQVTAEGQTRFLPQPFFVIATQNPVHQVGTFPLPESQLDRFLMRIHIGYPDRSAERILLTGRDRREILATVEPCLDHPTLVTLQSDVTQVYVADALLDYCQAILEFTRSSSVFMHGLSPRAGLALLRSARAWALIDGRHEVVPEDVQTVLPATVGHRLSASSEQTRAENRSLTTYLIESVAIP